MEKFYKVVFRYKNRLFSYASSTDEYDKFIRHQSPDLFCKEYRVGHWTRRRIHPITNVAFPFGLLFCFYNLQEVRAWLKRQDDRSPCTEIWECEVKNPSHEAWMAAGWVLADAVKLVKKVKR